MLKSLFRRTGAAETPAETPDTPKKTETPARQRVLRVGLLCFHDAAAGIQSVLASGLPRALDAQGHRFSIPIREDVVFSETLSALGRAQFRGATVQR